MTDSCNKCGSTLVEQGVFCPACGAVIDSGTAPAGGERTDTVVFADSVSPSLGSFDPVSQPDSGSSRWVRVTLLTLGFTLGTVIAFAILWRLAAPKETLSRHAAAKLADTKPSTAKAPPSVPQSAPPIEKPSASVPAAGENATTPASPSAPSPEKSEADKDDGNDTVARPVRHASPSSLPAPSAREGVKSGVTAGSANPGPSAGTTTRPSNRPVHLQLEAGIHLWIRVNTIHRRPDGSFTFQGTLLQPVTTASASLEQGTNLAGLGTVKNGHVTVRVTEFTVRGESYELRAVAGSSRKPGSGPAVELDPGKVIEMWLATPSVYERVASTAANGEQMLSR
jgi:hypothetical protein